MIADDDGYDAAKDAHDSYFAAVEAKRLRGDTHWGVFPYRYRWDRQGRKGQLCKVTARGKMNSCRVEFADGFVMITSRNAVRKR